MKYIFIDVDGTIIDHSNRMIPESTVYTINELAKKGHKLIISSGRAKKIATVGIDMKFSGYICSLGTNVYLNGKEIIDEPYTHEDVLKIIETAKKYNIDLSLECKEKGYSSNILYERVYQSEESSKIFQGDFIYWVKMEEYQNQDVYKMMAETYDEVDYNNFKNEVSDIADFCKANIKNFHSAEVCRKNFSKGSAIMRMVNLGIMKLEDTIAIGDSSNDISMFKIANDSIAMGQASDEVKKYAKHITDTVSNDGFYKAFKELGLIE